MSPKVDLGRALHTTAAMWGRRIWEPQPEPIVTER